MTQPARRSLPYLAVGLLALTLRCIYLWELKDSPLTSVLFSDSAVYDEWAREIAQGEWSSERGFFQAPLYPFFLG